MQLVFNDEEEAAVYRYAKRKNITDGEAMQRIIESMTKGLMELASEDDDEIEFQRKRVQSKTLDNSTTDSDSD